jgi:hypothetical protein
MFVYNDRLYDRYASPVRIVSALRSAQPPSSRWTPGPSVKDATARFRTAYRNRA